jgi:hypothetical protein
MRQSRRTFVMTTSTKPQANGRVFLNAPIYLFFESSVFQGSNLNCFIDRVASHPERLQYIYFNTILLLRAVSRLGSYLSAFDYCSTGKHEDDAESWDRLTQVLDLAKDAGKFDETVLFRGENANVSHLQFRNHNLDNHWRRSSKRSSRHISGT